MTPQTRSLPRPPHPYIRPFPHLVPTHMPGSSHVRPPPYTRPLPHLAPTHRAGPSHTWLPPTGQAPPTLGSRPKTNPPTSVSDHMLGPSHKWPLPQIGPHTSQVPLTHALSMYYVHPSRYPCPHVRLFPYRPLHRLGPPTTNLHSREFYPSHVPDPSH